MTNSDFRTPDAREEAERSAAADETVDIRDAGEIDDEAMRRAEGLPPVDPAVADTYRDAVERGANAKGEGRVP
jgi:hypothetical protein